MAQNIQVITGTISRPNTEEFTDGVVRFTLSKVDTDGTEVISARDFLDFDIESDGSFAAQLWENTSGENGTVYHVQVSDKPSANKAHFEPIGVIQVGDEGPYVLAALLRASVEAARPITTTQQAALNLKADLTALTSLDSQVNRDIDALQIEVDAAVKGLNPRGSWDASAGAFPSGTAKGDYYIVSVAGTVDGQAFDIGDWLVSLVASASTSTFAANWFRADYSQLAQSSFSETTTGDGTVGPFAIEEDSVSTKDTFLFIDGIHQIAPADYSIVAMAGATSGRGYLLTFLSPIGSKMLFKGVRRVSPLADVLGSDVTMDAGSDLETFLVSRFELPTRAAFVTLNDAGVFADVPDGTQRLIEGVWYSKLAGSTVIPDLHGWVPLGRACSPSHWGGIAGAGSDATTAVQAAVVFVRESYDDGVGTFARWLDLEMKTWRCTAPVNATNIRQPNFRFGNGGLYFDMTGGTGLELWGTNSAIIVGTFWIETPNSAACPAIGFGFGRCESSGNAAPIAPSLKGTIYIDGACSRASVVNMACEVSELKVFGHNSHPEEYATVYAGMGNAGYSTLWWGSEITSTFVTMPQESDGNMSNVLHNLGSSELKRQSRWNVNITGITQATSAVVSFSGNATVLARMVNGDTSYLTSVNGMVEILHQRLAISGLTIDAGGVTGSFTLAVDSTGFTEYTSGGVGWRATGYAAMLGGVKAVNIGPEAYMLSYSTSALLLDSRIAEITKISVDMQHENNCQYPIEMNVGDKNAVSQGVNVKLLATGQTIKAPFLLTRTTGTLRVDNLELSVTQQAAAFEDGLCLGGANMVVRHGNLTVPKGCDVSALSAFRGQINVLDPETSRTHGQSNVYAEMTRTAFNVMNGPIQVSADSDGGSSIPTSDFIPIKDAHVAGDALGVMRWIGGGTSYASIRARIRDATTGSEDASVEIVAKDDGADQILGQFDALYGLNGTALLLRMNKGGAVVSQRIQIGAEDSAGTGFRSLRTAN